MEFDPDLRLYSRLAIGRGWQTVALGALAALGAGSLALSANHGWDLPAPNRFAIMGAKFLAPILLIFGSSRATARLYEMDERGLLDQSRLCGRPPGRLLLGFVGGSMWPYVAVSALYLLAQFRAIHDTRPTAAALLAFVASIDVALILYGAIRLPFTRHSGFVAPLQLLGSAMIVAQASRLEWVRALTPGDPRALAIFAAAIAALPIAVHVARRRLVRPGVYGTRVFTGFATVVARVIPRTGPPELLRQLRALVFKGGVLWLQVGAPAAVVAFGVWGPEHPPDFRSTVAGTIPFFVVLTGAFVISTTASQSILSGAFELIATTPQRAPAVALSVFGGVALPFWTATFLAALTVLWIAPPDPRHAVDYWSALAMFAAVVPAVSLAEGIHRRLPASWLILSAFTVGVLNVIEILVRAEPARQTSGDPLWHAHQGVAHIVLVAAAVVVFSVGAVAGRLRRSAGASLAGTAACAGVFCVALGARTLPLAMFPRLLPALLVLLAPFAAEERDVLTRPLPRLAWPALTAFAAGAAVAWLEGIGWNASLATGAAGALALGIGVLTHELTWRHRGISLVVRLAIVAAVMRIGATAVRTIVNVPVDASLAIPLMPEPIDLAGLAAAFGIAFALHRRRHPLA